MKAFDGWSWKSACIGMIGGAGAVLLLGAGEQNNKDATGRFQLHAWSYRGESGYSADHGAFRIDTQTGEVWAVGTGSQATRIRFE